MSQIDKMINIMIFFFDHCIKQLNLYHILGGYFLGNAFGPTFGFPSGVPFFSVFSGVAFSSFYKDFAIF